MLMAKRIKRLREGDKVTRNEPRTLMDQLIERVLTVGARLAPKDRARGIVNISSIDRDVLSVALHGQLLQVGWESLEVLIVRQHRNRLSAKKIVVPDAEKPCENRKILLEGRGAEMLIHLVKAV